MNFERCLWCGSGRVKSQENISYFYGVYSMWLCGSCGGRWSLFEKHNRDIVGGGPERTKLWYLVGEEWVGVPEGSLLVVDVMEG